MLVVDDVEVLMLLADIQMRYAARPTTGSSGDAFLSQNLLGVFIELLPSGAADAERGMSAPAAPPIILSKQPTVPR